VKLPVEECQHIPLSLVLIRCTISVVRAAVEPLTLSPVD